MTHGVQTSASTMMTSEQAISCEEYDLFRALIERTFGLRMSVDRPLTFVMKAAHRLAILGKRSFREYYEYVLTEPVGRELTILASHVGPAVPADLREPDQLSSVPELLRRIVAGRRSDSPGSIRMLSAGCGGGEECYMLAAIGLMAGIMPPAGSVSVVGVDIDDEAIRRAREGRYSPRVFSGLSGIGTVVQEYFSPAGSLLEASAALKSTVSFRQGNMLDPLAFSGCVPFDIICCRAVFNAMTDDGIRRASSLFHSCLADDGYLVIGTGESLIRHTSLFQPVRDCGAGIYRKNTNTDRAGASQ